MATQQTPISATSAAATVLIADGNRRYLLISNYFGSAQTMWVSFTGTATCGTNGELEIPPGYAREFGVARLTSPNGLIANNETFPQPNCPTEAISVISGSLNTPANSATGGILVISP